jgi:hypothetical protein
MNWATFEQQLAQKLQERADVSEEPRSPDIELIKIATTITELYHQVAISSVEGTVATFKRPLTPIGIGLLSGAKLGIQATIFSALKTMQLTNIKPNMALMSPIGAAVVAYWGSVAVPGSISPFPPPAQYAVLRAPLPGSLLFFPGNPISVTNGFKNAFTRNFNTKSQDQAYKDMASDIRKGLEQHMLTIAGAYIGLVPGTPPFPLPTPWTGMRPL